jgi:hypothetical protein
MNPRPRPNGKRDVAPIVEIRPLRSRLAYLARALIADKIIAPASP